MKPLRRIGRHTFFIFTRSPSFAYNARSNRSDARSKERGRMGLSAVKVARLKKPGRYGDGRGLYLQVSLGPTGNISKSWLFQYERAGRERRMGLGSLRDVSLAEARQKADECRKFHLAGIDPLEHRNAARAAAAASLAKAMSFDQAAAAYIASHRAGWRNAQHAAQWTSSLAIYASPVIGALPVDAVDTALVMKILEPIWSTKPETASRVRGRIESVLDWARVSGYRSGENPARWRGHLDKMLPKKSRVRRVAHHAAMPYAEIGAFVAELRDRDSTAVRALEYLILTAARTGEVLRARWSEIDLRTKTWTIPAERMKAGKDHRVPLSDGALRVLEAMARVRQGEFVFPSGGRAATIGKSSLSDVLARMQRDGLTVHGFRSTFRDWAAERTNFAREVCEMALAHRVGDATEKAYMRGDLFEKRCRLMQQWADFCAAQPADVIPIGSKRHTHARAGQRSG
jgi:integrase